MNRSLKFAIEVIVALSISITAAWVADRFSRKSNRAAQAAERTAAATERMAAVLERIHPEPKTSKRHVWWHETPESDGPGPTLPTLGGVILEHPIGSEWTTDDGCNKGKCKQIGKGAALCSETAMFCGK